MNLRRHILLFAAAAAIFFAFSGAVSAQSPIGPLLQAAADPAPEAAPVEAAPPTIAEKRAENAELVRVAERKVESDPADAAAAAELAAYKTNETLLAQQEAVDQQIRDLTRRELELKKDLETWKAPTGEAPKTISFVEFDRLVNRLAAEQARTELVRSKVKAAKAAIEQAQTELNDREQERRKTQEAYDNGKETPEAATLLAAADEAKRASAVAKETAGLRKKELDREKLADSVQALTVELLKGKVDRFQPLVVFTEANLQEQLQKLKGQEESVRTTLRQAEDAASTNVRNLIRAKRRRESAGKNDQAASEEVEAWARARDAALDERNAALDQLLQIEQLRAAWNRLYQLMSHTVELSPEQLTTWKEETASVLKMLIGSTQAHLLRIEELRNDLSTIISKADAAKDDSEDVRRWIDIQRQSVESMIRTHEANLASIDSSRRLHGKLRTELTRGISLLSPEQWAANAMAAVNWCWEYELALHDDVSITVGKILRAIAIFGCGWMLSRMISSFFAYRLLKRFRLSQDAIAVIRTIIFYTAVMIAALAALRSAHVPLTAFTILGGAVAIGVGFGSQNLISNFISGLIMLAERPVRIGERVLFGNFDGVIEDVGFRCTKLRTGMDHLVTIPNSALINDSIENIGRRRTIRRVMNLGITYDTPRERVLEAVEAIRCVLEEPGVRERIHPIVGRDKFPPRVFFQDFTADSLNIQVIYWFAPADHWDYMEHAQRVNQRILEEFERLNVSFAFPSRTVYLANDSGRDLRTQITTERAA
ncbi:MAG: mechanosensitive ion channel domain-containing protein [Pirellulales bacterium]